MGSVILKASTLAMIERHKLCRRCLSREKRLTFASNKRALRRMLFTARGRRLKGNCEVRTESVMQIDEDAARMAELEPKAEGAATDTAPTSEPAKEAETGNPVG